MYLKTIIFSLAIGLTVSVLCGIFLLSPITSLIVGFFAGYMAVDLGLTLFNKRDEL